MTKRHMFAWTLAIALCAVQGGAVNADEPKLKPGAASTIQKGAAAKLAFDGTGHFAGVGAGQHLGSGAFVKIEPGVEYSVTIAVKNVGTGFSPKGAKKCVFTLKPSSGSPQTWTELSPELAVNAKTNCYAKLLPMPTPGSYRIYWELKD